MRKRFDCALREGEERLLRLFETLPVGIGLIDPEDQSYVFSNEAMAVNLGYTRGEFARMKLSAIGAFQDPARIRQGWESALLGESVRFDSRIRHKSGELRDVAVTISPAQTGRRRFILLIVTDITDRKRTEEALKESEANYRTLAEYASDGIIIIQDGVLKYANPSMALLDRSSVEELVGSSITEHISPTETARITEMYRGRIAGEEMPSSYETILLRKDGSLAPTELTAAVVPYGGRPAILAIIRDITERKRTDEELRSREEQLRCAIEEAPIPVIMYTEDGEVLQISRAWTDLTGYDFSEVPGFYEWLKQTYGEGGKALREHLPLLFRGARRSIDVELEIRTRSGEGRCWSFSASSPGILKDGRRFVVGMAQDITERKRVEQELSDSRKELERRVRDRTKELRKQALLAERERDRLMTLIDSMNEGVWFTQKDGRVVLLNSVAKRQSAEVGIDLNDMSRSDVLLSQVELRAPGGEMVDIEGLQRVFDGTAFSGVDVAIRNRTTGEVFYRKISANPILDKKKRVEGVITVVQDTTAEIRAEEEKQRLAEQLRQSQKMEAIGTLAGGIAHDFNNMLAVIIGNAELALDDVTDDGPKRNLAQIVKASKRARDLVKQILTFSRKAEGGKQALNMIPLVKETFRLLRGSLPAIIDIRIDIRTESDTIFADPSQIQQVLMNLATNAAYAMREKGGLLAIHLSKKTFVERTVLPEGEIPPGSFLEITVEDTGTGMNDEVRQRIFEPFFTTKQAGQGTGMGLAVVYGIVQSHAGAITVESSPGKGSKFTIFLPLLRTQAKREHRKHENLPVGSERVLLADDEPTIVDMASRTLERLGYQVTAVNSAAEAWKIFEREPGSFDLVITDQTMPGQTGLDLARQMLSLRGDLPIILITGYSETVSSAKAKSAGVRELVMKPLARRELAQVVRHVLDGVKQNR